MPVFVPLGPVHPHFVFELLAYSTGFAVYRFLRRREPDFLATSSRWTLIAAAAIGAALGSKLLALLSDPARLGENLSDPVAFFSSGKTMVGGLLGGWIAVELAKSMTGVRERTGDLFALPLCVGVAVGRVGCFLTGLPDRTCGTETGLPWGIDFGDGVRRHPTQLYEIVFVLLLGTLVLLRSRRDHERGALFRQVLLGYFAWRLAIDFLKPGVRFLSLTAIQWACALALAWLAIERLRKR